jgi:putative transposase
MARKKRIRDAGLLRHVVARGNGKMQIFLDQADYRKFVWVLSDILETYQVECWAYCLMPNHYHLVIRNQQRNLSDAIRHLNGEYGLWWNLTHQRVGHVFQGRFKDQIVQRERYLLNLVRYVAMNPVRARLVGHPAAWPWSSYRCTAGLQAIPHFVYVDEVLAHFGDGDAAVLRDRYARHVLSLPDTEDVVTDLFRSKERILGDRSFTLGILGERDATLHTAESTPVTSVAIAR